MNVLINCEYSAIVRDAFRLKGHNAWSCDLLPCDGDPLFHYQGDAGRIIIAPLACTGGAVDHWDLMIAHPPCTYICNSGVVWLWRWPDGTRGWNSVRAAEMVKGARFFSKLRRLADQTNIPRYALENPIPHRYARSQIGNYDQIIQPWMFGDKEIKATCLWLHNLPKLVETHNVRKETMARPYKERARLHWIPQCKDRAKIRSKTFQGVANAMAEQWG